MKNQSAELWIKWQNIYLQFMKFPQKFLSELQNNAWL